MLTQKDGESFAEFWVSISMAKLSEAWEHEFHMTIKKKSKIADVQYKWTGRDPFWHPARVMVAFPISNSSTGRAVIQQSHMQWRLVCLAIDRVFSLNKGDIWSVCAFQDSKLWATAAWSRGGSEPGQRDRALTQCLSPNVRQTCLGISIHAAASWNLKVWTELRSAPMIACSSVHLRYSHVQATRMSVRSILLGHGVTVASRMCFWMICLDMTWLSRRLRVGGLSSSEKKQRSSRSIANLTPHTPN
jgi:hypothetical protein